MIASISTLKNRLKDKLIEIIVIVVLLDGASIRKPNQKNPLLNSDYYRGLLFEALV